MAPITVSVSTQWPVGVDAVTAAARQGSLRVPRGWNGKPFSTNRSGAFTVLTAEGPKPDEYLSLWLLPMCADCCEVTVVATYRVTRVGWPVIRFVRRRAQRALERRTEEHPMSRGRSIHLPSPSELTPNQTARRSRMVAPSADRAAEVR